MRIRDFVTAVMYGAATYLGYEIVKKGIEISRDPVKKAEIKNATKQIRDTIKGKN